MAYVYYRRSEGPGCGGCLLILLLLAFLAGGAPALFRVLGVLLYGALFFFIAVAAAIWGTAWFLRRKVSQYERSQTDAHNEYVSLLVHILVKVAKHDGSVSREEVATPRRSSGRSSRRSPASWRPSSRRSATWSCRDTRIARASSGDAFRSGTPACLLSPMKSVRDFRSSSR